MMQPLLFSPIRLRELTIKNRIMVSPMCQYSAIEGVPNDWHLVHLGSRAIGGAGIVCCEATAVSAIGRISAGDLGIWNQKQVTGFKQITQFIKENNSVPAIQIAHAGRKASETPSWVNEKIDKTLWQPIAPSALAFSDKSQTPREMSLTDIKAVYAEFIQAAHNSLSAGFEIIEIHMAHGYLLNQFLSPLSNHRTDEYGGSIENRMRLPLEIATTIRQIWPAKWPVFVRISATDWVEGGWTLDDSILFSHKLKEIGIDLIDCSSGGSSPNAHIKTGPGYQVHLSHAIHEKCAIKTGTVGMITEAQQAEDILQQNKADLILLARELLRDPYWPLHAAKKLNYEISWPPQYERAK